MRVAFLSPSLPWSYGPYAQQLAFVAASLEEMGHDILWISMLSKLRNQTYPERMLLRGIEGDKYPGGHPLRGKSVVYAGTGVAHCGRGMYTSTINAVLTTHRASALISLMDYVKIFVDAPINVPSLCWFPGHVDRLDAHQRHVLAAYSVAVTLAPSSSAHVRSAMPYKPVEMIPHVVELPDDIIPRDRMRARMGIPPGSFLVFVSFGNYDVHNRKSVDVSLLAFKGLLAVAPDAKLFVHAVSASAVFEGSAAAESSPGVDLHSLLRFVDLPPASYALHTERVSYSHVLSLMGMADVLLQPSKTEGFCMPLLEAQLLGVPVVTTAFGAMQDYTMFGVAVPSLQPHYYPGMGFAATPNLGGVTAALVDIHRGRVEGSRAAAREYIVRTMSMEVVAARFARLISVQRRAAAYQRLAREAVLSSVSALERNDRRPWTLLVSGASTDGSTIDEDAIGHVIRQSETVEEGQPGHPTPTMAASVVGADGNTVPVAVTAHATLIGTIGLDGSPMTPTTRSPLLVRTAWLHSLLAGLDGSSSSRAGRVATVSKALDALASSALDGQKIIYGAVAKPRGGC